MKTIKIISLLTAIFFSLSSFSSNAVIPFYNVDSNTTNSITYKSFESLTLSSERVSEIVGSTISSMTIKSNLQEGIVYVEYHVENDGSVVVDQINTNNAELGADVKKQIENLFLLPSFGNDKKFYAKFNFIKL